MSNDRRRLDAMRRVLNLFEAVSGSVDVSSQSAVNASAFALSILAFQHARGVHTLISAVPPLALPAAACARSSFECGVRAAWLLAPEDLGQREVRWLAYVQENVSFARKLQLSLSKVDPDLAKRIEDHPHAPAKTLERLKEAEAKLSEWVEGLEEQVGTSAGKLPNFADMISESFPTYMPAYGSYRALSQCVHGAAAAERFVIRDGRASHAQDLTYEEFRVEMLNVAITGVVFASALVFPKIGVADAKARFRPVIHAFNKTL